MPHFPAFLLSLLSIGAFGCLAETEDEPIDLARCDLSTYRVVSVDVPTSAAPAAEAAVDIDGDGLGDNALGGALGSMLSNFESAQGLPELVNERLQSDDAPWFVSVHRCPDRQALVWSQRGFDLDGNGIYSLEERIGPPARGEISETWLSAQGRGFGQYPIGIFADPLGVADEVWSEGVGLTAEFAIEGNALVGRIGVGFPEDYFLTIARPLAAYFTERALAGTSEYAAELDANLDGTVTVSEMRDDIAIQAILLNPDLDLLVGERYQPNSDGTEESMSFSVSLRAEPVNVE